MKLPPGEQRVFEQCLSQSETPIRFYGRDRSAAWRLVDKSVLEHVLIDGHDHFRTPLRGYEDCGAFDAVRLDVDGANVKAGS